MFPTSSHSSWGLPVSVVLGLSPFNVFCLLTEEITYLCNFFLYFYLCLYLYLDLYPSLSPCLSLSLSTNLESLIFVEIV